MSGTRDVPLPLIAFTGRFQPFHRQHLEMVRHALRLAERVVIGVTNPEDRPREQHPSSAHRHLAEANPLSFAQRRQLIEAALQADGIAVSQWEVIAFPLDGSEHWSSLIPPGTPQLVRVFSAWEREKVRRFAAAGYPPVILEGDAASRLSASAVRQALRDTRRVPVSVPPGARELLAGWLEPLARGCHGG